MGTEYFVAGRCAGKDVAKQRVLLQQGLTQCLSGNISPSTFSSQGSPRKSIQFNSQSKIANYAISTGADGENRPAHRQTQTAAYTQIRFGAPARTAPHLQSDLHGVRT